MTKNFVKGEGYDIVVKLAKANGSIGAARERVTGMSGEFTAAAESGVTVEQGPDNDEGFPTAHVTGTKAGAFEVFWSGIAAEEGPEAKLSATFIAEFTADQTVVATIEPVEAKAKGRRRL